jgi:RES domain-containing protein
MRKVYRLIRERYGSEPLSAEGSRLFGGRWNSKGTAVLYTTSSPELGLVETLAHAPSVRYEDLPTYLLFVLEIPDSIKTYGREDMPPFWQDKTYERTQFWLQEWLKKPATLSVAIPSVIVPFSSNILVHPSHPLFSDIRIITREVIPIDRRLWKTNS